MKGQMLVETAAIGYSRLRNNFSTRAGRADVDGRAGAADCLRQRREPADRPGVHAAEGDRGAAVARRVARPASSADAGREHGAVGRRRSAGPRAGGRADARAAGADAVQGPAAADQRAPRSAHPRLHARPDVRDRHRLRPAAGAARQPSRSVDHAEGRGRIDRRHRRVARSCARGWSPRRWRSASCCCSAPGCSSAACRI